MGKKNLIDCIITVGGEKIPGMGEDSFCAAFCDPIGLIGVFDGCGGIGSKKYPLKDNRTGAYLASRAAKSAAESWFSDIEKFDKSSLDIISEKLETTLKAELKKLSDDTGTMKGSLVREFPTTVSVALFKQEKKTVLSAYFWAGDSRGYIFEPRGLVQLTRDDIVGGGDAYINLREDARLSNYASADGDFDLNRRIAEIEPPAMLICATDGCFGYFKTPMEFEYMILETMSEAESLSDWKSALTEQIRAVSGDDFSMNICLIGCGGIEGAKKAFKKRRKRLLRDCISRLNSADENTLKKLWDEYKDEYYG